MFMGLIIFLLECASLDPFIDFFLLVFLEQLPVLSSLPLPNIFRGQKLEKNV